MEVGFQGYWSALLTGDSSGLWLPKGDPAAANALAGAYALLPAASSLLSMALRMSSVCFTESMSTCPRVLRPAVRSHDRDDDGYFLSDAAAFVDPLGGPNETQQTENAVRLIISAAKAVSG